MEEERRFGEIMQEALDTDSEIKRLRKEIWNVQEAIQVKNIERTELTNKLNILKINVQRRKMEIREDISHSK